MTTDFEIEKATSSPIYDNNNLLIKKKLKADLNIHNLRSPSLLKSIYIKHYFIVRKSFNFL